MRIEKLSSVASDILGVSKTRITEELMKGDLKPDQMAELSKGRLRKKKRGPHRSPCGTYGGTPYVHDPCFIGTYEGNRGDPRHPGTQDTGNNRASLQGRIRSFEDNTGCERQHLRHHRGNRSKHGSFPHRYAHFIMVKVLARATTKAREKRNQE